LLTAAEELLTVVVKPSGPSVIAFSDIQDRDGRSTAEWVNISSDGRSFVAPGTPGLVFGFAIVFDFETDSEAASTVMISGATSGTFEEPLPPTGSEPQPALRTYMFVTGNPKP
jgi:hypothetical protein